MIGFGEKKSSKRKLKLEDERKGQKDIRGFFGKKGGSGSSSIPAPSTSHGPSGSVASGNVFGFGGTSYGLPGTSGSGGNATKGRAGTVVVNPQSRVEDNSSGGRQIIGSNTPTPSTSGGGGHRLSGEGGELSANVDARQMVRSVWAGKYDSGGGGRGGSVKGMEDGDTAKCPVCSRSIQNAHINQHLDECLTKQALMEDGDCVAVLCQKCKREVNAGEWKFHDSVCS